MFRTVRYISRMHWNYYHPLSFNILGMRTSLTNFSAIIGISLSSLYVLLCVLYVLKTNKINSFFKKVMANNRLLFLSFNMYAKSDHILIWSLILPIINNYIIGCENSFSQIVILRLTQLRF